MAEDSENIIQCAEFGLLPEDEVVVINFDEDYVCVICNDKISNENSAASESMFNCTHALQHHQRCLDKWIRQYKETQVPSCTICRKELNVVRSLSDEQSQASTVLEPVISSPSIRNTSRSPCSDCLLFLKVVAPFMFFSVFVIFIAS